ncbi:MAG: SRPBCC family protein [Hamadaea sp.]|nr:SRPBCC family protein [Hamadaea sp.]
MRTVEAHAALTAGPDRVWECIADPTRWNEWLVLHKSWKGQPPGAAVEGLSATAAATAMNMPITIDWTFEKVDVPHRLVMGGTTRAGVKLRLTITLTGRDTGTLVDVNANVDGGMIDGPMGAVFKKSLTSALDKSLKKLDTVAR